MTSNRQCIYCDSHVADPDRVQPPDDDAAWASIASKHRSDCEWAQTRAHRVWEVSDEKL